MSVPARFSLASPGRGVEGCFFGGKGRLIFRDIFAPLIPLLKRAIVSYSRKEALFPIP